MLSEKRIEAKIKSIRIKIGQCLLHNLLHTFTHGKIALKSCHEVTLSKLKILTSGQDFNAIFKCVKMCATRCMCETSISHKKILSEAH